MKNSNVVRAWRDYEFHEGLAEDIKSELPTNPAGTTQLMMIKPTDLVGYSTYIGDTCDTYIGGCCSTYIGNTCSTFIGDCCAS